jgi:hypothetical protein
MLVDRHLQWRIEHESRGASVVRLRPRECAEVDFLRRVEEANKEAARQPSKGFCKRYGPKPAGQSKLERLGDPLDQLVEIQRLAVRKDDPDAWSDLANAYRVTRLRDPLGRAMAAVGWEHIALLVSRCPVGWPDGLAAWIDAQRMAELTRGKGPPLSRGSHDTYWLADW